MDSAPSRSESEPQPSSSASRPPKSPPMAFAVTSNDALHTPNAGPSHRPADYYFTSTPGPSSAADLDAHSPFDLDMEGQLTKQREALRLQHQAFSAERESWDMERQRLYKRIAALESLLKSPRGCSPAKSPDAIRPTHSAPASSHNYAQRHSSASSSTRLPSIAEHETTLEGQKEPALQRDNAPGPIEIPPPAIPRMELRIDTGSPTTIVIPAEDPPSPPGTQCVLSPPPPEYLKNAGHTPLRGPSRPESSSGPQAALEDTPTRRNTARNVILSRDEGGDHEIIGPLKLPELPNAPDATNFTMDALTARLQYIEAHPDENRPLALSAKVNWDTDSEADTSDQTLKPHEDAGSDHAGENKDTPSLSQSQESAADVSPPPTSDASQSMTPQDVFQEHKGIKLRSRASMNFGAPLGQLR